MKPDAPRSFKVERTLDIAHSTDRLFAELHLTNYECIAICVSIMGAIAEEMLESGVSEELTKAKMEEAFVVLEKAIDLKAEILKEAKKSPKTKRAKKYGKSV